MADLNALWNFLTGAEAKKLMKQEEQKQLEMAASDPSVLKHDWAKEQVRNRQHGTMKGVGWLDKINDLLGGRAENTLGEGPISTAMNFATGDLDPTTAGGAKTAALIPNVSTLPQSVLEKALRRAGAGLNTTAHPNNAEELLKILEHYKLALYEPAQNSVLTPNIRNIHTDLLKPSTESIQAEIAGVKDIVDRVKRENPALLAYTGGVSLNDLYTGSNLAVYVPKGRPGSVKGPRVHINPKGGYQEARANTTHEFTHAAADQEGTLERTRPGIPWGLRNEEARAVGNTPTLEGVLPDDQTVAEQYLTGYKTLLSPRTSSRNAPNEHKVKSFASIEQWLRENAVSPNPGAQLGPRLGIVRPNLTTTNLTLARQKSPKYITQQLGPDEKYRFFYETDLEGLRPEKRYNLQPLIQAILKGEY